MSKSRIEFLREKLEADRAALAAEMVKKARRDKRDTRKLDLLLGGAVRTAGAQSPDFRLMIAQTALVNVNGKERQFLAARGWLEEGR
jgi:hypothetical protein